MWGELASTRWLLPLWRELAQRASSLPYRADSLDTHAAALWLQAGGWSDARDAVLTIESWRRIPAPLAWMAEASYRLDALENTWPLLAELAWLAPDRCARLVERLGDKSLDSLLKKFYASFEGAGDSTDIAYCLGFDRETRYCSPPDRGATLNDDEPRARHATTA